MIHQDRAFAALEADLGLDTHDEVDELDEWDVVLLPRES